MRINYNLPPFKPTRKKTYQSQVPDRSIRYTYVQVDYITYVQSDSGPKRSMMLPRTKAATYMLLGDNVKTILHGIHGWIRRKA